MYLLKERKIYLDLLVYKYFSLLKSNNLTRLDSIVSNNIYLLGITKAWFSFEIFIYSIVLKSAVHMPNYSFSYYNDFKYLTNLCYLTICLYNFKFFQNISFLRRKLHRINHSYADNVNHFIALLNKLNFNWLKSAILNDQSPFLTFLFIPPKPKLIDTLYWHFINSINDMKV